MPETNERVRDLFGVQPAEFVRSRDALVKELHAGGHEAQAKEVAALRRPTAALWAVNQLARKNRPLVEEFVDASERVRRAQLRGASADELRIAMAAQRGALTALEQAAVEVLRNGGAQASPSALRTIQATLQAAATGPDDVREQLLDGTLREALEPAGFDALFAAGPVRTAAQRASAKPASERARLRAADKQAEEATRQQKEDQRAAAREARRQLAEARKRRKAARAAERRLRTLEQRARTAEAAARRAREALEAARVALERLRS